MPGGGRAGQVKKPELRALARDRLRRLTPGEREGAGEAIAERIWTLPELVAADTILLFASLPEEVSTQPLARSIRERGHRLVYPRSRAGGLLVLHEVPDEAALVDGRYGIREPAASLPVVPVAEVRVALAPGLAWDREGTRLGRGGGYFDRLFGAPGWGGFVCGVFHSLQEVERIPRDPWDAPLGAVVTEREVWRPAEPVSGALR